MMTLSVLLQLIENDVKEDVCCIALSNVFRWNSWEAIEKQKLGLQILQKLVLQKQVENSWFSMTIVPRVSLPEQAGNR